MAIKLAVIGTGPSGIYAAEAIKKKFPDTEIDFLEKLPTPYGLVRYGVAPDHQGTKNVTNLFDKFMQQDGVRLIGNIDAGKNITIPELKENYDFVIIATGARNDRKLNIPGENLENVTGSAAFVGWYNSHPNYADLTPIPQHAKNAVIIGNGNVAIDIARILVKSAAEMQDSDLANHTRVAIDAGDINLVTIAGRRSPADASFTPPELRELGKLDHARPVITGASLPETTPDYLDITQPAGRIKAKILDIMHSFSELEEKDTTSKQINLEFLARPTAILGDKKVEAVQFERMAPDGKGGILPTQELFEIAADFVVTAVGYGAEALPDVPFDKERLIYPNEEGHIHDNLYVVGWAKRGPSGTIPTNRPCSNKTAKLIMDNLPEQSEKLGAVWLDKIIKERGLAVTYFDDWQKLDQIEKERSKHTKSPRQKFTTIEDMQEALQNSV